MIPIPAGERTFLISYDSLQPAIEARDGILRSFLQPSAVDLLNPQAASQAGQSGFVLAVNAGGNRAVLDRYERELGSFGSTTVLDGPAQASFWRSVQNFTADFVARSAAGCVVRISTTLAHMREAIETLGAPVVARGGSGVCYAHFETAPAAAEWMAAAGEHGWKAIMEFAPEDRAALNLWPKPGNDLGVMEQVKLKFDPDRLLNRGRLYNRI